jgi:hypothetical protein
MDQRRRAIIYATDELILAYGGIRPAVQIDNPVLRTLHATQNYAGMVREIRNSMNIDVRIRLGIATNDEQGRKNAPAWIGLPQPMPIYGTKAFNRLHLTIYIRRSFLREAPFETVVVTIAHEISHIVISATHRYARHEQAVDLTAMILGYRLFFLKGSMYSPVKNSGVLGRFMEKLRGLMNKQSNEPSDVRKVGYLSESEIEFAHEYIEKRRGA